MRLLPMGLLLAAAFPVFAAESTSEAPATINRILDEGLNHSSLPETAAYLTDRIGGRLTNSPQMREAEKWTQAQYRDWGLKNIHTEGFDFGRGWSIEQSTVRMVAPRTLQLRAIPVAWTPGTKGTLSAPIIVAPITHDRDFAKWKGKLSGKIVLISWPDDGSEPSKAPFERLSPEDLAKLDVYKQPVSSEARQARLIRRIGFAARREAFLAEEGALAWVRKSYRDGGLLHGEGYDHKVGETPALPGVEVAAEDYRRLARLAKSGAAPVLEITSSVKFYDDDHNAYNVFAEIPGKDAKAGYVMAGAHLDSWVAADGASDNGAGSVVVMEAARILAAVGVKPKRTIRFALWAGEEQGLLGSLDYVERHLATRPPPKTPEEAKLDPYATWPASWPVTPRPGYTELAGYFNIDNGSGKVRGIYTEGNLAVVPIFREWLAPFASMGATTVASEPTGGTDHVFMQSVGLPAFQFIQDPLDYGSRVHHSSIDTFDHLKMQDLKQASVILASMLAMAANHDTPLPRKPVPMKPKNTDPFSYDDLRDDDDDGGT